jgi:hypothetical protein
MRTATETQALATALDEARLPYTVLHAGNDLAATAALERAGSVVIAPQASMSGTYFRAASPVPLRIVVGEMPDAERHLIGLCRALNVGRYELYAALEDEGVAARTGWLAAAIWRPAAKGDRGEPGGIRQWLARRALRRAEQAQALARRGAVGRDRQAQELLAFAGGRD